MNHIDLAFGTILLLVPVALALKQKKARQAMHFAGKMNHLQDLYYHRYIHYGENFGPDDILTKIAGLRWDKAWLNWAKAEYPGQGLAMPDCVAKKLDEIEAYPDPSEKPLT